MLERYKRGIEYKYLYVKYVLTFVFALFFLYYQWIIGTIFIILFIVTAIFEMKRQRFLRNERSQFITNLAHRVDRVGEQAFLQLPFGVILYNEQYEIEWCNPYVLALVEKESLRGEDLQLISERLAPALKRDESNVAITIRDKKYDVQIDA